MKHFIKHSWEKLNGSFEFCTSWKMSDTMIPSRMRSVTKMAVKAFERSPSRAAPWAISPHQSPWVRLPPARVVCVCLSNCVYLKLQAAHLYAPSHTCTHTNTCQEQHHHPIVCPQSHRWPAEVMHSGDVPEVKHSPEDPLWGLLSCN